MDRFLLRVFGSPSENCLPDGWTIDSLDNRSKRGTGHTPDKEYPEYWNGGIKWVSLADSDKLDKVYINETDKNISPLGIEKSSAVKHPTGTVILSRDAGVGKSAILGDEMAVSQHFIAWVCGPDLHNLFLYYWLQFMKQEFERIAVGSTIKTIGMGYFTRLTMPFPPLPEQRKIADILSTWDRTIGTVEQLVATLQERKRGLTRRLLTGQVRFPEYQGSQWKEFRLGDVFTERRETGRIDLPLLSITGKQGVIPRDSIERRDTSNEDKSKYLRIYKGDLGYNTMRMWQGVSAVSPLEGIVSPAYTICTPTETIDISFMSYLFKFPPIVHLFWRYSQGLVDDTLSLKFAAFSRVKVIIPHLAEQRRIATLLRLCDSEIGVLERKLTALKQQKHGLMQRLLTGQVRVRVDEEEG